MAAVSFLRVNPVQFETAVHELRDLVAIRSVSNPASPDYSMQEIERAADFVGRRFDALGFSVRYTVVKEGTAPFVIAEKIVDAAKPTLLLYAHYDVQPVDRNQWNTPPFVLTEREGRLYGRGASDDKAGVIAMLTAVRVYRDAGEELPVNLKILVEGEEEYGSEGMSDMLQIEAARLHAQALIILDGGNRDINTGTIENSTRGIATFEMEVRALEKPVHSGVGCLVPDPAIALAKLIASLEDPAAIPGFLSDCIPLASEESALLAASSQTAAEYHKEMGVVAGGRLRGDPEISIYERIVSEPSISILNMTCGHKGGGNSIQSTAHCTFGVRLTPGQDPDRITDVVLQYLWSQPVLGDLPLEVKRVGLAAKSWKANLSGPFSQSFYDALGENYPQRAIMPTGGTLPLIEEFEKVFPQMEVIIAGVEDPDTAAHSHNESQDKGVLEKTTNSLISFFAKAGAIRV